MPKSIQPIIEALFADSQNSGRSLTFSWRLIRRKQRPFLLLPDSSADMKVCLELYSAQRPLAKLWRAALPWLIRTPAAAGLKKTEFTTTESKLIHFLSEQSSVPVEQLQAPAIKFGGLDQQKARLVLLLCDQTHRPVKVIKIGLNAEGRAATQREADLLATLPTEKIGCIRMTGRIDTENVSAFATAYFPGHSPENDAGLETLFNSWLNSGAPTAIEKLGLWQELENEVATAAPDAWGVLRSALVGKNIRTTLYHGDFAPWNIRAINSQNLQAFDWERGSLHGIPGWDWFHFTVQTSTLARRHSVERIAAEVEELLASPRFQTYAQAAGISDIIRPLLLAYLLHHRWVIQPLEGGNSALALHELLSRRWQLEPKKLSTAAKNISTQPGQLGTWPDARRQIKSAVSQFTNLFWEPTLNSRVSPSISAQLASHWGWILSGFILLAGVATAHAFSNSHLVFLPFYLVPIILMTLKVDRRWGAIVATIAAVVGPLIQSHLDQEFKSLEVGLWNVVMRFITLQMCVLFADRINKQKSFFSNLPRFENTEARPLENWAVLTFGTALLGIIAAVDYITNPHLNFIPVYLVPCMIITLAINFRWGIIAAIFATSIGSISEHLANPTFHPAEVFGWNLLMRLAISLAVISMLERIRRENVLFFKNTPTK